MANEFVVKNGLITPTVQLPGATSGTVTLSAPAVAGTTTIALPATAGTIVTTGDTGTVTNTMLAGSIANDKLVNNTISGTALGGTLPTATFNVSGAGLSGSATYNGTTASTFTVTSNATSANTVSTIVSRDASGNFSAGTITAALNGNASTASTLQTARTITLSGDVAGSVSFNGSTNVTITTTIQPDSVALGTDTTGNYVATVAVSGTGLSVSGSGVENAAVTVTSNATNANTASTIVARDASGNFSAGTITAALSGNASTASALQTARTISLTGDVTGSVSFDGSGNAAIATTIQPDSVALGTDTTGNYMVNVTAGTGVSVSHTQGEGSTATVSIGQAVGTTDNVTFNNVTVNGTLNSDDITSTNISVSGNATITGNLTVSGTTTTVNSTTISIADANIELARNATTAAQANGAGITIIGAGATFNYASSGDKWQLNKPLEINSNDGIKAVYDVTDGQTWLRGWGIESDRGAVYIRPLANNTQNLRIGYGEGSLNWNTVRVDATNFTHNGNQVWHAGNLTNLNQLTNGPGYITGYTETDTLATVTGRGATTSGAITISSGTTDQGLTMTVSDSSWNYIGFNHGATRKAYFGINGSGNPEWGSDSGALTITGNYTTIGTSTRSPIFYDSDNTSYYLDPNSGTSLVVAGIVKTNADRLVLRDDSIEVHATDNDSAGVAINYYGYASGTTRFRDFNVYDGKGGLRFKTYGAANFAYSPSSFRAPIFYDSDDTGYYLDPNAGSALKYLRVNGDWGSSPFGSNHETFTITGTYASFVQRATNGNLGYTLHHIATDGAYYLYGGRGATNGSDWNWSLRAFPNTDGNYVEFRTSSRAPIFYDSNDTTYYVDPNSNSKLVNLGLGGVVPDVRLSVSGDAHVSSYLYMGGTAGSAGSWGTRMLGTSGNFVLNTSTFTVNNVGYGTTWSIETDSSGTTRFNKSGYPIIAINNTNPGNYGLIEWQENGAHKMWMGMGGSGQSLGEFSAYAQDGFSINHDAGGAFTISNRGSSKWIRLSTGAEGETNFHTLNIRNGDVIVNQNAITYSSMDNTPVVGSATTNRLHVNGSIQLTGNNDAIVFGRGSSSFMKDEEIGFGWGGGWYMTDGTFLRVRNPGSIVLYTSGTIRSDGDIRSPIYYDQNDTGFYADPNGTSRFAALNITSSFNTASSDVYANMRVIQNNSGITDGMYIGYANSGGGITRLYGGGSTSGALEKYSNYTFEPGSFRSPIFYDSNNTGYYADPASTSIFNQLTVDGDPVRTATHSGSDFVNGTLVQTDIDSSGWSGASFRLEATGKSYGAGIPFMFMAEGYLYADTIINYNGVHLGHNGFSTMKIFNNNGTLAFWWPRVSYWNSFEVRVIDAGGSSHNRVTSITDVAEPSGATVTKKVTVNMAYYMRGDTSSSNADTIRSVNFRASNAYYLGENNWFLNNTNGGWYSNVRIQSADDMRAPIFYDSNDTGYYFDGASTTRTNIIQTNYIGVNQAYNSSWPLIVNGNAYLNGGGYGQAEGSWRAPIFYDSNNTGYYTDPASTSVMNTINLGQVNAADGNFLFTWGSSSGTTRHLNLSSYGGDPSQAHGGQSGITWGYRSDSQAYYMIHLTHGDYSAHTKLTLSWHTGIRIGAAPEYGGTAFYNNSLNVSPSLIFSVGRGDGNVRVTNDIRSPIYYDLNDTNYYADPNSTSRFSSIRADNWFRPEGETGLYSYSYAQHFYPDSGGFYWESDGPIRIRDGYEGVIKGYVGYHDSTGFGLLSNGGGWWLNTPNNNLYLVLGGNSDQTPYGNAGAKLMFCGGSSDAQENYYIGTNFENFGGNYAKLDLRWHTGIRIGAQPGYGGVRIYDSEDMGTIRFSVNKGDAHTRVESGDFYAANLIDRDDTNYYLNPNGTSRLVAIDTTGGTYNVFRTWTDLPGHHGFYSSVHNGAHLRPNDGSYGSWRIDGSRGGWCGIEFAGLSNGNVTMMVNPDSNTSGFHNNSYGWQIRWNNGTGYIHKNAYGGGTSATIWDSSNLTNLNQLTNGPGYIVGLTFDGLTAKTAGTGTYTTTGDFRAPIFYNHTDTGYYVDPDSLSVMNRISLGYNSGENNSIGCSNWFRSSGSTGWYNASYAGGIYMEDSTWVRVYNNKQFYAQNYILSDSSVRAPIFYESANTAWYVDPGSNSLFSGNLSLGTTFNPTIRLHVRQISSSTTAVDSGISVLNDAAVQGCATGIRFSTYGGEDGGSYAKQYIGSVRSASGSGHGPLVFCNRNAVDTSIVTLSDERMRIDPTGFVQASVDFRSPIYYDSGNTAYYVDAAAAGTSVNVAGSIIAAGNVTAYSDIRLKTNIRTIDNAIDKIKKIRGVTFDRTDNPDLPRQAGVIAQEVKEVLPEVVSGSEESKYTVAYGNMVGLLIEAIKEQQSEIDELKALVRQLLAK